MKTKLYPLILLLFLSVYASAQFCNGIQITYTAFESRCVSTGALKVEVSGGSGLYNYQVNGPVSTPFTSSAMITGLQPGNYQIVVKDLMFNCTRTLDSAYVPGDYSDPRFQLDKTNVSCRGNDGTISVANQQFGRAPFTYTIIAPSPSSVGASNATGNFSGLIPGEYAVQLRDSCGGIQVRRVTIENYIWWIDSTSLNRVGCDSAKVFIRVRDNQGNVNTAGTLNGFTYGIVRSPGDTLFTSNYNFQFFIGNRRTVTIVVKDNCGNLQTTVWTFPPSAVPQLGSTVFTNYTCSTFSVSYPSQANLTNPLFCLYDSVFNQISCNSTGTFNNLPYGQYCVEMQDFCYDTAIVHCFTITRPQPSVNPTVDISNQTCSTFTASITGQAYLFNPSYCLLNSNGDTLSCNSTGVFNNLPYGNYCIRVRNGCNDTTIVRCFTATRPVGVLTSYALSGSNCSGFNVTIGGSNLTGPLYCLYDSTGQVITCNTTGVFNNLPYANYCVRAIVCGDTTAPICFGGVRPVPAAGTVQISNRKCDGFTATVTGQVNLTAPQYCLYNSLDTLISCNTTGVFTNLAYGSYCIKIKDSCTDSTIVRCFSASLPRPSITTVLSSNAGCSGFTATINGSNLTKPLYCMRDSQGNIIRCDSSNVFTNIPWGRYCFSIKDGCVDTTMTICQTFTRPRGLNVTASKSCVLGNTNLNVLFYGGYWPFRIKVFRPNGTLALDTTTNTNPITLVLPALPSGGQYKIEGTNSCGDVDSLRVTPNASAITHSVLVNSKCPSAAWQNGAGDLIVSCASNFYPASPTIIKKNGAAFSQSFASVAGSQYTFTDLEPATYVVEYNMQTCNSKVYDTVTIAPYAFPTQGQSAIYQCDNNALSLGANVQGGIGPYSYQIIGSTPSTPSIVTGVQSSPIFSINTGTIYSLVRLRAIDACGNATLDDVSVLPLQNFSVTASNLCFYQNIMLTVNAIPNATYTWYRKTTPTDSVLVGSGAQFNLPFFVPEQIGQYVCIINVHGGCSVRRAVFTLDGNCGGVVLPTRILLKGKKGEGRHELTWTVGEEGPVKQYELQRKKSGSTDFETVAIVPVQRGGNGLYQFTDLVQGGHQYRVRAVAADGRFALSNVVLLQSGFMTTIYPNPVKDRLTVVLQPEQAADFRLQLIDATGRIADTRMVKATAGTIVAYTRQQLKRTGVYLLSVQNTYTGEKQSYKILVE